jgi:hypothetical protein
VAASAAALLPWFHIRFTFLSLALEGALLVRIWQAGRPRRALPALGPFLLSAALFGIASQHWYGSPWPTAPFRLARPRPHLDAVWGYAHSVGGIFDPDYGWLPFAPLHVLAFVGLVYLCLRRRPWALAAGALSLTYLLVVVSAKGIEGGFAFPARLQLVVIPLGAIPVLLLVREVRPAALIAVPLAALTFALSVVGVARIDQLIYSEGFTAPSTLPLARTLGDAWPHFRRQSGDPRYKDLPKVLAWVAGITLAGSASALWARDRGTRGAPRHVVSVGSE